MVKVSSKEQPSRQRTGTRRRTKKRTNKYSGLSVIIATSICVFVSVWCIVVFFVHTSLGSLEHAPPKVSNSEQGISNGVLRRRQDNIPIPQDFSINNNNNNNNPWEGWQPPLHSDNNNNKCSSWRHCFHENHNCHEFCRDDPRDFENAPKPPQDWIPDVTILRRMMIQGRDSHGNPWPPPLDSELCETIGFDGGRADDPNGRLIKEAPIKAKPLVPDNGGPKILCMIYTMEDAHATRIRAIRETWAGGCDGFLAFSTASDPRIPAISIPHEGKEEYNNMWQKIRSMWKFVAKHYMEDFDFFFIGGDDLYVLPQNLRNYLGSLEGSPDVTPHFVGRRFKSSSYFYSGGAGYALSRAALTKFMTVVEDDTCGAHAHTSMEDVMIAKCLLNILGLKFQDTRDDQDRERFHPFAPGGHLTWKPPKKGGYDWYEAYNKEWGVKLGTECCAPDSVSFHYMKKQAMVRHVHALLYNCPKE